MNMNAQNKEEKIRFLKGQYDPEAYHFVLIDPQYLVNPDKKLYMQKEAYEAFVAMAVHAKKDQVILKIVSATRLFEDQKLLWENKFSGKRKVFGKNLAKHYKDPIKRARAIMQYSAPPGLSRHHWGTDIDINTVETDYFKKKSGKKVYEWLSIHASKYGYCQTYTKRDACRPHGYNEEKWHWSYLPLADQYWLDQMKWFDPEQINGFMGCEAVRQLPVLEHFIKGIYRY